MLNVLNTPGGHMLILMLAAAAGLGMRMSGDSEFGTEIFEHASTLLLLRMGALDQLTNAIGKVKPNGNETNEETGKPQG